MVDATNNSTSEESNEEIHVSITKNALERSISDDSNEVVDLFDIHSLREAY